MKNIIVVGAGTMGSGIAHLFAVHGFSVGLVDQSKALLDAALASIGRNVGRQIAKGSVSGVTEAQVVERLTLATDLAEPLATADLVVEAITEDAEQKGQLFAQLDKKAPAHAILASNTSSISITKLARATRRPQRVIGMHFMNPVPIVRLVEVVTGYATEERVTKQIVSLAASLDKDPVVVRDYPGFVSNRILMPMINEAIYTLNESVASVEAIDAVMKGGMGHPMGPLQLADFIGLDVCLSILKVLYEGFGHPKYAPCPLLVNMVEGARLGLKSGEGFYRYNREKKRIGVSEKFRNL